MADRPGFRQLVDWRAALLAGLFAGVAFFLLQMALTAALLGSPWVFARMTAAIVLGRGVLPPPATFDSGIVAVAFALHLALSLAYAALIAFVLHRGGLVLGIVGGAAFGLALYAINYWTFAQWFPWFLDLRSGIALLTHVLFGALAGGMYELLEVERFVPAPAPAPPPIEAGR
jgi:hypothetical protein